MSRRFGRNQRRRAREALASAQAEAVRMTVAYEMANGLSEWQGKKLRTLEEELATAKAIAWNMSVLFPADRDKPAIDIRNSGMTIGDAYRGGRVQIKAEDEEPNYLAFESSLVDHKLAIVDLDILLAGIDRNAVTQSLHAWVRFKGEHVAYGISPKAWMSVPPERRVDHIMRIITRPLALELTNALKGKTP